MLRLTVHPATRLIVCILLMLAVQSLSGQMLALVIILLPVLGVRVLRKGAYFIWRTRWLLISLLIIFSWGGAGEPLWSIGYAPTYEGTIEGATHLGRLLLVLFGLAAIQETMAFADLLAATHTLLQPLRVLGFDPDRGVVRLMLVIRYVEALPRPRDWRSLLDVPPIGETEQLSISHHTFGWFDRLILVLVLVVVVLFCYFRRLI